jgi:hypothetical protein
MPTHKICDVIVRTQKQRFLFLAVPLRAILSVPRWNKKNLGKVAKNASCSAYRVEECRKMLVALTPVQYQAVLSILRAFAGQQPVTNSTKKEEKATLLVNERSGRKFRLD